MDYLDAAFDATEKGTWEGDWSLWEMYKTMQISTFKKFTLGIAGDVIEYGEAWFAAQDALAEMKQIVQELQNLRREANQIRDEYNEIDLRLIDLCKDYGGETGQPGKPGPKEPPSDKPPEPKEPPAPPPPEPKPPTEPPGEPPPDEPSDTPADDSPSDDNSGEEPPPPPPPPPQTPRGSGGIPINCECDKLDRSSPSAIELSQVNNSIEQLVNCFDQFMNGTIKPFQAVNDSGEQLFNEIEQALNLPQSEWGEIFKGFLPRISGLKSEFTAFGEAIQNFSETSKGCSNAGQKLGEAMVQGAAVPELKQ